MELADGEYEIDLLVLLPAVNNASTLVAIRYGFIPDSMDQKQSLRLYQNDQVCILEAQLVERTARLGLKPQPIIFEGVPQGQRLAQSSATSDLYFLLFSSQNSRQLKLQRLENVIRVSKLRNTDKWRTAIGEWKEKRSRLPTPLRRPQENVRKPAPKKAMKRPPVEKEEIISVSDFEDLDDEFPVFEEKKEARVKETKRKGENEILIESQQKKTVEKKEKDGPEDGPRKVEAAKSRCSRDQSIDDDLDDEFKDLEDELEEVMEKQQEADFSESDDNSDFRPRSAPILIKVSDEPSRPSSTLSMSQGGRKPISLRELYGGNKAEDLSSSEEE